MTRKRSHKRKKRTSSFRKHRGPIRRRTPPPPSRDERVLRERIQKFTYQDRFKDDFERAIRLYFGEGVLRGNVLTLDEEKIPGFQEWYIYDYIVSEGERIIDLFAREVGPRLPAAQRQMLDDWRRTNRYRLFEVQKVEPGIGVTVQDLLSGEVFEVNDVSASYALVKWQVFLARPLLTEGRLHFTGSMIPRPPMDKPALLDFARELWEEYQKEHPQASLDNFYRDHSLDLHRRLIEIATAPLVVYTPEGHLVCASTARYAVKDPGAVEERLDQAEEFVYVGPADEDETALAYVWLLRGRSRVPEVPVEGKGLIMRTDWMAESGEPTYRSLGDVRLWQERLELSCLSRERLAAGKMLLRRVLGRLIRHLGDEYRDLDTMLESVEPSPPRRKRGGLPQVEEALVQRILADQRAEWLDTPVPMLGEKSPREASRDPAMREQLEELLKAVEYMEEQKRRAGEPYMDVADLRRELGLPLR